MTPPSEPGQSRGGRDHRARVHLTALALASRIFAAVTPDDASEARLAATTVAVVRAIGAAYGHRLHLTASTR